MSLWDSDLSELFFPLGTSFLGEDGGCRRDDGGDG